MLLRALQLTFRSYVTRLNHESHLTWQAQYLVKFNCHFSWQGQHVKFGMIAGARTAAFFTKKCLRRARQVTSVARRVANGRFCARIIFLSCSDHGGIILGSWSDRPRIVNNVSAVFEKFRGNFGE